MQEVAEGVVLHWRLPICLSLGGLSTTGVKKHLQEGQCPSKGQTIWYQLVPNQSLQTSAGRGWPEGLSSLKVHQNNRNHCKSRVCKSEQRWAKDLVSTVEVPTAEGQRG